MALQGAELLFYPTAIGSEPILECDSMEHWRRCMQGHAASNLIPVIAANRIGEETVEPCPENGMQKSALNFYGSSFITDNTGALLSLIHISCKSYDESCTSGNLQVTYCNFEVSRSTQFSLVIC